ncbi:MAG TPA: chemotaxis protein CheB [Cyanobacteria bacterium UBA11369]|nr:chemotaxis protein CheB [Cyanobacteria bacterium UBA11371]HBE30178.1 chemotaxis protein CheB [Cyanobacteria bacterium UBA11368]HBE49119.1 chemotaxis protein CheB [Cyanobacteria bacterium UBA11369]
METKEYKAIDSSYTRGFDIVAIAASADGLKALIKILSALPSNFPVPIVIVQHISPKYRSFLAQILNRQTSLTVKQAEDGEKVYQSKVYIAPPDYHMLVTPNGTISLSQSPKVHFSRPSADVLFESVAQSYKERAIAVVLTGGDSDGSKGVEAIKNVGGIAIAQDRATSTVFGMPAAAIATGCVDFVLPLPEIAGAIANLVIPGGLS